MQSQFGIGPEQIDALFKYGKELYECGAYAPALDMLDNFSQYCLDAGRIVSADWGKLACHILMQQVRARAAGAQQFARLCARVRAARVAPRALARAAAAHAAQQRIAARRCTSAVPQNAHELMRGAVHTSRAHACMNAYIACMHARASL